MKNLKDKNALITGAGSGIGRLMALAFAREGANIAIIDINKKALADVEKEIKELGVTVHSYECDIAREKDVAKVVKAIEKDFPSIDLLVNNAGIVAGKFFSEISMAEMRKTMDVNFFGHVIFTKHFLPSMIERGEGHIVNIASSAGLQGFPKATDYNASKFAEVGFTESLRMELKKFGHRGIKTTLVCPYVIDTGMFDGFKPLLLNPILKPEYVVKRIVKAVKKNKPILKIPFTVNLTLILKPLPVGFSDWLLKVMGITKAMDGYTGHRPRKS